MVAPGFLTYRNAQRALFQAQQSLEEATSWDDTLVLPELPI